MSADQYFHTEAEQGLLGTILFENKTFERVRDIVQASDFYHADHASLFELMGDFIDQGQTADCITLRDTLRADGVFGEELDDRLAEYLDAATFGREPIDYAHMISKAATKRQLTEALGEGLAMLREPEADLTKICEGVYADLEQAQDRTIGKPTGGDARDAVMDAINNDRERRAMKINTGFHTLDNELGGLTRETMTVLAARPSMGKTALAVAMARNIVNAGHSVGYFSLEMPRHSLGLRDACYRLYERDKLSANGMPDNPQYFRLDRGNAPGPHYQLIRQNQARPGLLIDDRGGLKVHQLNGAYRAMQRYCRKRKLPEPSVIVVDHLGHVRTDSASRGRTEDTGVISKELLAFAKRHKVAVLALVQLNRQTENDQRKPRLADLRWSGEIEEDAHAVMFLHRESYYLRNDPKRWDQYCDLENDAEIIIAKNRDGGCQTVKLWCDMPSNFFSDPYAQQTEIAG